MLNPSAIQGYTKLPMFVEPTSVLDKPLGLLENWNFSQHSANQVVLCVLPDAILDCQRWQLTT